ncbi:spore coat protein [Paenibacillus spiritus]|uniref:Spore coat protein n=1 Tax=Paenibacillus spiritus TaxID=2496557 RepID=A0A5J5GBG0_9BACL|nr:MULTISPECIES: spore coat protein [Paenibacillus]KAA9005341.1 spore coat protein [Paenibacillus spiritus]
MNASNNSAFMPDEDLLTTVLCDLKRTVREYTTAATESNCPSVRRVFNDLTMDTLRLQGELYQQMGQLHMYQTPGKALRQTVDQAIQSGQQTQQKCQQFVQQKLGGQNSAQSQGFDPQASMQQQNGQSPYYM